MINIIRLGWQDNSFRHESGSVNYLTITILFILTYYFYISFLFLVSHFYY
jgi:hypothetical protein